MGGDSEATWHDLLIDQREQATSLVLDIVAAQLTALAHSIIEYDERGGKLERAKKFVRRMSVKYQLPISQRQLLLEHLSELKVKKKNR